MSVEETNQDEANLEEEKKEEEQAQEEEKEEKEETSEESQEEEKKDEPPIDTENIEESLKDKGFDYNELQEEYLANGDLSKETREKLAKIGISEEFINDFIAGKKAVYEKQVAAEQAELAESVGGKEVFDNVIKWAAENLSEEEKLALNDVRSMTAQKWILQGFKNRMEEKEGVVPSFVNGNGQASPPDVFESQAQMIEAIKDKRYTTDPAYAAKVTAKIRASRKAGINLGI